MAGCIFCHRFSQGSIPDISRWQDGGQPSMVSGFLWALRFSLPCDHKTPISLPSRMHPRIRLKFLSNQSKINNISLYHWTIGLLGTVICPCYQRKQRYRCALKLEIPYQGAIRRNPLWPGLISVICRGLQSFMHISASGLWKLKYKVIQ